jgi:NTE family protein
MLRALYERGITPDLLVGTSVGALNAAFIASRPQAPGTAHELAQVWQGVSRGEAFPLSLRAVLGGLAGRRDHLVPAHGLSRIIERHIQLTELGAAPVPLHLVAFDLGAGTETVLSEGPAAEAILASCAIPGIFPPVSLGGRSLVDGGVFNNTPISHAVSLGADRVYVLSTQAPGGSPRSEPALQTALDAGIHGLGLMLASRLASDIARHRSEVELIVLPVPNPGQVQPIDFGHCAELIRGAYSAARTALAAGADLSPAPVESPPATTTLAAA